MKNFGCIVPVSFIFILALLLSGCASSFGERINKPVVYHKAVVRHIAERPAPVIAPVVQPAPASVIVVPQTEAPVVIPAKKKGFWSRIRSHIHVPHFHKKPAEVN